MKEENMSEEQVKNDEQKLKKSQVGQGMALGAGIGVALGAGIGAAMGNIAIGTGIGVALGAALGMLLMPD